MSETSSTMPTEPEPACQVRTEFFDALDGEFAKWILTVLSDGGLAQTLVSGLLLHLPEADTWRLTISGDVVASVNAIEKRDVDNSYTVERGAGQVGGRTVHADDGTHDVVIGVSSFMPGCDVSSPEVLVEFMHRAGAHTAIHESGHVLLRMRGEDAEAFEDLATGSKTERAWRKHLAAHVDDFRIEKMTNRTVPTPYSRVDDVDDALSHMVRELTASSLVCWSDGEAAAFRSSTALNDLIRAMTYLGAEVGSGGAVTKGVRPEPLPVLWNKYIETVWDVWALNLDRLKPADEPMAVDEIAAVLTDLCKIIVVWSRDTVGYHFEMHHDGSWTANWLRSEY